MVQNGVLTEIEAGTVPPPEQLIVQVKIRTIGIKLS